jgi:hypothetical protein
LAIEEKKEEFVKRKHEEDGERYVIYLVRVTSQTQRVQGTIKVEFTEQELVMVLSAFQIIKKVTMQVLDEEPEAWMQDKKKAAIYDSILQKVERAITTTTTTTDMCIV